MGPDGRAQYRIPEVLTGKRVLDIGAWDGYWTFETLKRGARGVIAIDDFSDFLGKSGPKERHAWPTFDLCRAALGWSEDLCKRMEMTVYDLSEELLGRFDAVFFSVRHATCVIPCWGSIESLRSPTTWSASKAPFWTISAFPAAACLEDTAIRW
jgi:hypothetical protein